MNPESRKFDDLLDRALDSYTPQTSRPGLDNRILARLDEQTITTHPRPATRPFFIRPWQILTATAALLVAIVLHPHSKIAPQNRAQTDAAQMVSVPLPQPIAASTKNLKVTPGRRRQSAHSELRSQPSPLLPTPQELLLAQFVSNHRAEALAVSRLQASPIQPLNLKNLSAEPIVIAPIQIAAAPADNPKQDK
jgi:hypothetical protein